MHIIIWSICIIAIVAMGALTVYLRLKSSKKHKRKTAEIKYLRVQPLYLKLKNREEPDPQEIYAFANDTLTREETFCVLLDHGRQDLFPAEFYTIEKAAESYLENWLDFPTELDSCPDEMEYVAKVNLTDDKITSIYHVFRFCIGEPHWAAKKGWMLGVVGPYNDDSKPYDFPSATFSRFISSAETNPNDEALWVHNQLKSGRPLVNA